MKILRPTFLFAGFVFCVLFLAADTAYAQLIVPRTYLFVEVRDVTGQAVTEVTLKVSSADGKRALSVETNKEGVVTTEFPQENYHHYDVQVSKSGYLPYEQIFFSQYPNQTASLVEGLPDSNDVLRDHPFSAEQNRPDQNSDNAGRTPGACRRRSETSIAVGRQER